MTVPVLITDLSTTALLNAPSGEDAPSTLDNIQRAHASFIAQLRDGKDASGGYAGLTLFKLNLRNAANTFTSFLTNTATAARTWLVQDRDGTVAFTDDITGGTRAGSFTTLTATNSAQGDPATTGSTQTYGTFRMRAGNGVLDGGVNGTAAWLQATDANVLGSLYTLKLNPNGGSVLFGGGGFGYGVGAGGAVTQATSKATAVTLNKPCGQITTHNAALAASASVTFQVFNSIIVAGNVVILSFASGYGAFVTYRATVEAVSTGSFYITLTNISAGSLSEALTINFAIIKGVTT